MQMRCRGLDVVVLVLARAAFCSEQAAAMNFLEIPIGEFVVPLGVLGFFVINSQIPFAVFGKAVQANEFILLLTLTAMTEFNFRSVFVDCRIRLRQAYP